MAEPVADHSDVDTSGHQCDSRRMSEGVRRVVLLNREIVLTEQTPQEFAAEHDLHLFAEDSVAVNRAIQFKIETFEPTENFKPTKPYQTRLKSAFVTPAIPMDPASTICVIAWPSIHSPGGIAAASMSSAICQSSAYIATAGAVIAFLLEVIEERTEEWRIQIRQGQLRGGLAKLLLCVLDQQAKGIAIARDGVGARLPLSHQSIHEE